MSGGQHFPPPPGEAFPISRRGYDPVEVENYLRELDTHLRMVAADRDAAIEQNGQLTRQVNVAWAETDRLKTQLRRLSAPPESVEGMSERLQSMLRLAQDEVSERRKRAEAEAHEILARAQARAGELPTQNEAIRRQLEHERKQLTFERNKILSDAHEEADLLRSRATADADRIRSAAATEAESSRRESDRERQLLDDQSSAKRTQVEEDFDIAMSARRAEAMTLLRQRETDSRSDAADLVARARAEASRMVEDAKKSAEAAFTAAQHRVAELDDLRTRLASELTHLRGVLDAALPPLTADLATIGGHPGHRPAVDRSVDLSAEPGSDDPESPTTARSHGAVAGPATPTPNTANNATPNTEPSDTDALTDTRAANTTDNPGGGAVGQVDERAGEPGGTQTHTAGTAPAPGADTTAAHSTETHAVRPSDSTEAAANAGENGHGSDTDSTPNPRSSPEFRPSPRRRWPAPAGRNR